MEFLKVLLVIVEAICSILIVGIILLQKARNEGLGLAFGANVGESLFGSRAGNILTRGTITLGSIFVVNTVILAMLFAGGGDKTLMEKAVGQAAASQAAAAAAAKPAAPAPAAPATSAPTPAAPGAAPVEMPKISVPVPIPAAPAAPAAAPAVPATDKPAAPAADKPATPAPAAPPAAK